MSPDALKALKTVFPEERTDSARISAAVDFVAKVGSASSVSEFPDNPDGKQRRARAASQARIEKSGIVDVILDYTTHDFTEQIKDASDIKIWVKELYHFLLSHKHFEALTWRFVNCKKTKIIVFPKNIPIVDMDEFEFMRGHEAALEMIKSTFMQDYYLERYLKLQESHIPVMFNIYALPDFPAQTLSLLVDDVRTITASFPSIGSGIPHRDTRALVLRNDFPSDHEVLSQQMMSTLAGGVHTRCLFRDWLVEAGRIGNKVIDTPR